MTELKTIDEVRKNHKRYEQMKRSPLNYLKGSERWFGVDEEKFEDVLWEWCSHEGDEETRLSTLKSIRDDHSISDDFYERFHRSWINNMDKFLEIEEDERGS